MLHNTPKMHHNIMIVTIKGYKSFHFGIKTLNVLIALKSTGKPQRKQGNASHIRI